MPHPTSAQIGSRIEELYGASLTDLDAHAQDQPPGMLAALLAAHHALALAEQTITVHRERLGQLVHPERQISAFEVVHIVDCARRLSEAVAVRDTQAVTTQAVLQSLGRTNAPAPPTASTPCAVPAAPVPTVSTVPSR
ncbi:hypothetical protein [Streptomyces griseiscabiei]|uniref:HNH endonuclease n=1 Tax=Streptomyces griseiscabiei TaxID=2993540 RepID=A0ABU4KYN6_9ACTN|nr:hypothetical protein [Streptomyces griseiscabiei]MBZ3904457.1 hypothetical protein [Streptomyces griseiscabiei]MDX2908205.1 hypothetical protein [Streptomyces griseiscabiei]